MTRFTPEQLAAWNAVYEPKNEAFLKANLKGKDLVRWKYQRYIKDYLRCIASVDDNIGRLMDYLDESGLAENTVVIYSSDQGFYLGEHGWFDKRWMYEESLHMPFIVKWPGVTKAGSVNADMVQNIDFAETFLDMAGLDVEIANSPGRSFANHLEGNELGSWNDAVFMDQEATRVIRTSQYSYWKRLKGTGDHELYDIQNDPGQEKNLFGNPDYADVISGLDKRLTRFFDTYSDAQYDLWRGGTVKGTTESTQVYKSLYGDQWEPESEIRPAFREDIP